MPRRLLKQALRWLPLHLGEGRGEGQAVPRAVGRRSCVAALSILLLGGCDRPRLVEISERGGGAYEASLARLGDGWAVAWHDTRDGHPEIYARLLDVNGHPTGPPRRLTDTPNFSYEPQIAASGDDELVVAWYTVSASGASVTHIGAWSLARDGGPRWVRALSHPARRGRNVIVRVENHRLFCAWIEKGADDRDAAEQDARNLWSELEKNRLNAGFLKNQANIAAEFLELARRERQLGNRSLIDVLAGETALINANSDATARETDVVVSVFRIIAIMGKLKTDILKTK